jgi:hypothetical protein
MAKITKGVSTSDSKYKHVPTIREDKIILDPTVNKYKIDNTYLDRVTSWINTFEKPFNPLGVSVGLTSSNNKKGIVNTLTPQQRVHYWNLNSNRATSYGTGLHIFSEMYDLDPTSTIPMFNKEYAVVKFIKDSSKTYRLIGNELKVYSKRYKLAGTIDRLIQNIHTGKYCIMDWKTSSDIDKTYNKYPKDPFKKYPQCKRSHYEIQLGTYRLLGNIILDNGRILHIQPDMFEESRIIILKEDRSYNIEMCNTISLSDIQIALDERVDPSEEILIGI